jgi:hypothetical protein
MSGSEKDPLASRFGSLIVFKAFVADPVAHVRFCDLREFREGDEHTPNGSEDSIYSLLSPFGITFRPGAREVTVGDPAEARNCRIE